MKFLLGICALFGVILTVSVASECPPCEIIDGSEPEILDKVFLGIASEGDLNVDVVKHYIAKGGDINVKRSTLQDTALHFAAIYDQPDVVKYLIENGAHINPLNILRYTPLHQAASHGRLNVVKVLIEKDANVNIPSMFDDSSLDRVKRDDEQIIELLRNAGAQRFKKKGSSNACFA